MIYLNIIQIDKFGKKKIKSVKKMKITKFMKYVINISMNKIFIHSLNIIMIN